LGIRDLSEPLEILFQCHGIVMFSVLRAKEQCDRPLPGLLRELLDSLALIVQLRSVSLSEFGPQRWIVPKRFS
jgi:hypothetical protein